MDQRFYIFRLNLFVNYEFVLQATRSCVYSEHIPGWMYSHLKGWHWHGLLMNENHELVFNNSSKKVKGLTLDLSNSGKHTCHL
jgi:hypothetical protein